jgi:2-oxo-4-hydroxy-4-carboxy-5-ureidoimidazoline decarboxylase
MACDQQPIHLTQAQLAQICTSVTWQQQMLARMPCHNYTDFSRAADDAFARLTESDWLEAFAGHPMIGDLQTLQQKYAQGKHLSEQEQGQVSQTSTEVLEDLLHYNRIYRDKFGFIFIICATGQSAEHLLSRLKQRIQNSRTQELQHAAVEQQKISHLRMESYR